MQNYRNPQGQTTSGVQLVRMGKGLRVHAKHPYEPGTLCLPRDGRAKAWTSNLRPVSGVSLNCYRCLKLRAINQELRGDKNAPASRSAVEAVLRRSR